MIRTEDSILVEQLYFNNAANQHESVVSLDSMPFEDVQVMSGVRRSLNVDSNPPKTFEKKNRKVVLKNLKLAM